MVQGCHKLLVNSNIMVTVHHDVDKSSSPGDKPSELCSILMMTITLPRLQQTLPKPLIIASFKQQSTKLMQKLISLFFAIKRTIPVPT